jgi:shikimate kinase / 3-dehydroquinate synthase
MINEKIFFYGPPGSGKSTVGRLAARSLGLAFHDLDAEIEIRLGKSVSKIFATEGEPAFRDYERAELQRLLDGESMVVALGGGTLVNNETRRLLEDGAFPVVLLDAPPDILAQRLQKGAHLRPLLAGNATARLQTLLAQRRDHYASFALRLDTTQLNPEQAAWEAQIRLGMFRIQGMAETMAQPSRAAGYDVRVQPGGLDNLGEMLRQRQMAGPVVLVSDQNVAARYAGQVENALRGSGYTVNLALIEAGEEYKTMQTISGLWAAFMTAGIERSSTIVALGGGVVTDQAGFAAATYLRGVRWVAVPTTLLGMVDASLGGKTGVDLPQGKNLVGAFHAPSLVLADPHTLATLPTGELRSGLAETIKHGILADQRLLSCCAALKRLDDPQELAARLPEIVARGMAVKVRVIEVDPFEQGQRAALNLGHTVGHAIELASGFRLRHGEAVAIGMIVEARMAEDMGLAEPGLSETIAGLLADAGLPTEIPADLETDKILRAMQLDKKRAGSKVRFALPVRLGEAKVGVEVDDERRKHALDLSFARSQSKPAGPA